MAACRRAELLTVMRQVSLGQPPFEEGPRIDARCAMRLEEHQVAALNGMLAPTLRHFV